MKCCPNSNLSFHAVNLLPQTFFELATHQTPGNDWQAHYILTPKETANALDPPTKENTSFRIQFLRASSALAPFAPRSFGFDALSRDQ
jgi:hypothetical protein